MDLRRVLQSLLSISPRAAQAPRLSAAPPLMQAALSAATAIVRDAVATQGSLTTLYANLEAVVTAPAPSLPAPVLDAAKALLAMRFDIASGAGTDDIKAALVRSGFTAAPPASTGATQEAETADLGTALVGLRDALKNWLDQETTARNAGAAECGAGCGTADDDADAALSRHAELAAAARGRTVVRGGPVARTDRGATSVANRRRQCGRQALPGATTPQSEPASNAPPAAPRAPAAPMPPYRGAPNVPQPPSAPSLSAAAPPREQAAQLLAQTDAAIARQTLLRIASLPGVQTGSPTTQQRQRTAPDVRNSGGDARSAPAIAPMTIERDARRPRPARNRAVMARELFHRSRLTIGPVHVRIMLVGERASVDAQCRARGERATVGGSAAAARCWPAQGSMFEPGELRCPTGYCRRSSCRLAAPLRLRRPAHFWTRRHERRQDGARGCARIREAGHAASYRDWPRRIGRAASSSLRNAHDVPITHKPELAVALSCLKIDEEIPVELIALLPKC